MGHSAATAGDVNGDGYGDVLVGTFLYDNGEADEGRVGVYHGSASGLSTTANWTVDGNQVGAELGVWVGAAGDVNGDGYEDVIAGARGFDNGQADEGRAFVHLGNDGSGGCVRALQQRSKSDVRPIALLGSTQSDGLFRIRAEFPRNLLAFSWVSPAAPVAKLEWEVKPLGVPFDGLGIERSAVGQFLVPPGGTVTFDELAVAGLEPPKTRLARAASFHWRARIATNNPLFPHTAWFSPPGNSLTEAKLRKPKRGP
jgi:hypothetical protein